MGENSKLLTKKLSYTIPDIAHLISFSRQQKAQIIQRTLPQNVGRLPVTKLPKTTNKNINKVATIKIRAVKYIFQKILTI